LMTDVVLPGINGRVLADQLAETRPGIKILFISAFTENVVAQNGKLVPGTTFLQKPFTHKDLARKLREILDPPNRPIGIVDSPKA